MHNQQSTELERTHKLNQKLHKQLEDLQTQQATTLGSHQQITTYENHLKQKAAEGSSPASAATLQTTKDDLRQQLEILRDQQVAKLKRNQKEQQELQRQLENSQSQHEAALEQNRQICAERDNFQQKVTLLQKQHAMAVEKNNQIITVIQAKKHHFRAECERLQVHRRASNQIALVAVQQVTLFREAIFELRRQTEGTVANLPDRHCLSQHPP